MTKLTLRVPVITIALSCFAAPAAVITVNTTNNVNPGTSETNLVMALNRLQDGDTIQFSIRAAAHSIFKPRMPDTR